MSKVEVKAKEGGSIKIFVDGEKKISFCRCGKSKNLPRCDGTHREIGFAGPAIEETIIEE